MIRRIVIILFSILLLLSFLNLQAVFSQENDTVAADNIPAETPAAEGVKAAPAAAAESVDGMEALVDLLKNKGVLSAEDASAFRAKRGKGQAPAAEIEALVAILTAKGILSKDDAAAFNSRVTKKMIEAQDQETTQRISENVTKELRKEQDQQRAEIERDMRREFKERDRKK
jgi:hypothetical protein